jgi:hypothetical protein
MVNTCTECLPESHRRTIMVFCSRLQAVLPTVAYFCEGKDSRNKLPLVGKTCCAGLCNKF